MKLKVRKLTPSQIRALRVIKEGMVVVCDGKNNGFACWTNGVRRTSGEKMVKASLVYLEEKSKTTSNARLTSLGEAMLEAIDSVISAQNCISTEERLDWNEVDAAYRIRVQ